MWVGGRVRFDLDNRTVETYCSSGNFGFFNEKEVEKQLKPYLKELGFDLSRCKTGW